MLIKLKNAAKVIIILAISFFGALSFAEETNQSKNNADVIANLEQALSNHEMKKQHEQEVLAAKLNASLNQLVNNWIDSAKKNKNDKIGNRLEQTWERLAPTFNTSTSHYDYYLRGYKYAVVKSDISRTDSFTTAYKAEVVIKEDLYVEKYHPSNVSDINLYFYTVSTNYYLNFEYRQNKFTLVNSDSKIVGFANECPLEIKNSKHIF